MKKPDCLTYEGNELPIKGWARDRDDQEWKECWLIAQQIGHIYRFSVVSGGCLDARIQFTTTDPNLKSVRELIEELPAHIVPRAMRRMDPERLDERVEWPQDGVHHPLIHTFYLSVLMCDSEEGADFWLKVCDAIKGKGEFPKEPLPKLTQDYLADKWEPWAKWAAVDSSGSALQYAASEKQHGDREWLASNNSRKKIPGNFDATDWKNSLIEKPIQIVDYDLDTLPPLPFEVRQKDNGDRCIVHRASEHSVFVATYGNYSYPRLRAHFTHADGSELGVEVKS